jgi:hypothetical protein
MRLRYCNGKDKYSPTHENKRRRTNIFLIKQLAKHLLLTQGWLIKRTVQNEPFVTKFSFIADACTIVVIYYVERTLVNCYNLCPIQLL